MVGSFEMLLVKYGISPSTEVQTALGVQIARTTTQQGCSWWHPAPSSLATASKSVAAPLLAHHPREFFPDCFSASLVIAEDLMEHVVGCGGRGLKQVTDISSARVSTFTQEVDGCSEHLISIWGTDKQLGNALVMLGKWIVHKRVSAPKKKKKGTAHRPVRLLKTPLPPESSLRLIKQQLLLEVEHAPPQLHKPGLRSSPYHLPLLWAGLWRWHLHPNLETSSLRWLCPLFAWQVQTLRPRPWRQWMLTILLWL